ncbi:hypothetical protein PHYBLDRAFT_138644 [Phycomyces blakesleeanus NRRL 1555(-)]|uniref:Uncharacterized protein n=1 Tax=Phycomyces blakesleeanus (strain ATCC 8743b / DSM 1359 / FGSC 10004 / NBRC 33097 / NRRL 1555) TaxID=763407 RepID=A0A167R8H0_PHYB8|nr:hypothetical protein PHYBLDRAFT_138644 [Phycomyces blakesleeanus NRRL 1555(-)]OAD81098.1 hypothetical protein PHYBLDRAFT_138644 [Phycomyces blakesleeanus NRRL 1555(-)]|eukprot:XP_018299138.1 hypothetical protein PHYBLDRAFT_138644 [Phycomyces blakesleeanus NRRL 1555(-)]
MASFGENDKVTMPQLSTDEVEHVLVTHNESTFYSNDGKEAMWLVEGENPIRKKGPGMSLMISEFKCACHSTMSNGAWSSRKSNTISLFEVIHSGCKAIFVFAQSDKEVEEDDLCTLRDTTFVQDKERGMWLEKDPYNPTKKWRLDCKKDTSEDSKCCAHHFLASQPDFMSQKTALHEAVETYKSLDKNIHSFLDHTGKLQNIRRYYNCLWCYIEAYCQDMNVKEAHDVVKNFTSRKHTSHCRNEGKELTLTLS